LDEFDASRNFEADAGDAIAEPLYALLGEVFDMRGVFKILRKSLIAVVQVCF
jgi:sorting nexin-25